VTLGTGDLSVGRGPEHFRPRQGGINPREQEPPLQVAAYWHLHTEPDEWKNTQLTPHAYHKVGNIWARLLENRLT